MNEYQQKKGFWEFFIIHRRFTFVIIIALVLTGLISVFQLPKEANPEVDVPFAVVTTFFPGAAAEDVEELVTDIIEAKIKNLDKVEEITSTSRESFSSVAVQFDARADGKQLVLDLKDKINETIPDLPIEAEDPIVRKINFSNEPILTFALSGPYQIPQLKQFGEELKTDIESIPGVSEVVISGGQEREIQVLVNKNSLDSYGFSISQVTSAIKGANADIPTGSIETAGINYNIRLAGRITNADEIKKVPISRVGNAVILVEDVATITDGFSAHTSISRLGINGNESDPSIVFNVIKTAGADVLKVVDTIEQKIEDSKNTYLPENINSEILIDMAFFTRESLNDLFRSGIQAVIIVLFLLLSFLGLREAVLASIAIPMSFLITLGFISVMGSTLNGIVLFALVLSLGILIDSAIVVVEGMHTYIEKGLSPKESAFKTVSDFKLPLIAGTMTTVFAFVPMLLMSGIMGEFIKHIPITVTITLLSSLFVALALVTTVGVHWLRPKRANPDNTDNSSLFNRYLQKTNGSFVALTDKYYSYLNTLLRNSRSRKILRRIVIGLFVFSLSLPISGIVSVNMFPQEDFEFFYIDIKAPISTPLEETAKIAQEVERFFYGDERIDSYAITAGSLANFDAGSVGASGSRYASIFINLNEERKETSIEIVNEYETKFRNYEGAEISINQLNSGPPTGAPVEIVISGKELKTLEDIAGNFEDILKNMPGTRGVGSTIQESSNEFLIEIDRAKAALYGINTVEVAGVLRNAVSGTTATVIRGNGDETDVKVKYALNPINNLNEDTHKVDLSTIESLTIATRAGDIPLSAFTKSSLAGSRPQINHEDGERIVRVTSFTESGVQAQEIFAEAKRRKSGISIPSGYTVKFGGETEDIEQSYTDMFRAMILAIFLIAGALILQFNSYRQPMFILVTIPLAIVGVFPGLLIMGKPLSFPGIIGIVALVGITVNNAIILIDRINKNRILGMPKLESTLEAAKVRLRPIVLTTITTVLGLLPITLTSDLWGPLGYSIIFGLSVSTVLTVFIVPMLYVRFARDDYANDIRQN